MGSTCLTGAAAPPPVYPAVPDVEVRYDFSYNLELPSSTVAHDIDTVTFAFGRCFATPVRIALVGKYTDLQDAYNSVIKALQHAAIMAGRKLVLDWVDACALEPGAPRQSVCPHARPRALVPVPLR